MPSGGMGITALQNMRVDEKQWHHITTRDNFFFFFGQARANKFKTPVAE